MGDLTGHRSILHSLFCLMPTKEQRVRRAKLGLCVNCGKPKDREDTLMCSKCIGYGRRRRERYKESGGCIKCGKPTDGIHSRCDKCLAKDRERGKKDYRFYRDNGICVSCHRNSVLKGELKCADCAEKAAENAARYREKHPDIPYNKLRNERNKQRRKEAKEKGYCTYCFKRKATEGYTTCIHCRMAQNKRARSYGKRKGNVSYDLAVYCGICTTCRREKATHGKLCKDCYDKHLLSLEKARQVGDRNQYWIEDNKLIFLANNKRKT